MFALYVICDIFSVNFNGISTLVLSRFSFQEINRYLLLLLLLLTNGGKLNLEFFHNYPKLPEAISG